MSTLLLALRLLRPDVPILQTRLHQIKRKRIAQKARRVPCMPMSLIVLILLVSVQVRLPRPDDFSLFTVYIVFHHDGPFDACAPSRNRHRTKAPMYAWTSINAEDEEVAARYRDKEEGMNSAAPALSYDPSYSSDVSRSPPATANYSSYYSEPPKKKVDAIAEAWGIHEPEPYEEFFAGGGDHDGPITNSSSMREARSNGRRAREDLTSRPRGSNRIPPPQPIFIGDRPEPEAHSPQPQPISGGANIGRNKSIISRIRKMRDSPNVPVGFDERMDVPADGGSFPNSVKCGGDGCPTHGHDDIRSFRSDVSDRTLCFC